MRIDKYLWCVRLCKSRSTAAEYISKGRVLMDEQLVKPSKEITIGVRIKFRKGSAWFEYKVTQFPKSRLGAKLVDGYLEDITPAEQVEKYRLHQVQQISYRENGGKPNKADRNTMRKLRGKE